MVLLNKNERAFLEIQVYGTQYLKLNLMRYIVNELYKEHGI